MRRDRRPQLNRLGFVLVVALTTPAAAQWRRHTIDNSSRGADGVRLADVNGDGRADIATGWEEGGQIRVYLNPGPETARKPWPAVTVGRVRSPEDAVFVDADGDGAVDVISSCEGRNRTMFIHWAPRGRDAYLDDSQWKTEAIPCTAKQQSWMFALPMELDGRPGREVVVASKGKGASIGWLERSENPRKLAEWRLHDWRPAGWIMSLDAADMDGDGDRDVIATDRKGKRRGVLWLENPGPKATREGVKWREHMIGGQDNEVMFLDLADLDADGRREVVVATRNGKILVFQRAGRGDTTWKATEIPNPHGAPNGKAVRAGDLNLDGRIDLFHTVNNGGKRQYRGATWLESKKSPTGNSWQTRDVSGREGVKFDLIELIDLDADGDLDAITCEERDNLGVFWYENPTRQARD